MSELEQIKRRKLEAMMRQSQHADDNEEERIQQQISQLENIARSLLTKDALARYGTLKAAHPERALQLLIVIGNAVQQGKIRKIDDNMLKEILRNITPEKREIKIRRA